MRTLLGFPIPNIDTSDLANFPTGRFKNDSTPTSNDGTELSERTLGDIYQAMIEILRRAGITANELAEDKTTSQLADAILGKYFIKEYTIVDPGDAEITFDYARNIELKSDGGISRAVTVVDIVGGEAGAECTFICAEADSAIIIEGSNAKFFFSIDSITDLSVVTGGSIKLVKRDDGVWQVVGYIDGYIAP